ncbi:MAG TPA: nitronate monooxygenase [Gaiellaceae bacterium]|jgi:NAD(P)H-dependent flavin oxidoreductase YrpB (nitropropane dioxygenase family)|nr:nitronate monooxygenase [Gaiellaceae bacterium]
MLTTPLCRRLGIEAPVCSVGFGTGAGPELAAAVSEAGGLGVLGGTALRELLGPVIDRTRERTAKPIGVNLILHEDQRPTAEVALARGVEVIVLFWGDPAPIVELAAGTAFVIVQVGSVEEARRAVDAGVDAVIAQGVESGGHVIGTTALSVLVPAIVDAISPVPVLASGGIADGRGLAAALVLGAQAVSLGTRFVASDEAFIDEQYKQRVVAETDTVYSTDLFDGGWADAPHRVLRNAVVREWEASGKSREGEPIGKLDSIRGGQIDIPRYAAFMTTPSFHGDVDEAPLWAGQSVALVRDIRSAGEIVRTIVAEAEAALYSATTYSNDAQQSSANSPS